MTNQHDHQSNNVLLLEIEQLAEQVGEATESLKCTLQQCHRGDPSCLPLYLVSFGNENTAELLLKNWLIEDGAAKLRSAGQDPMIIGPSPDSLPRGSSLFRWHAFPTETLARAGVPGHLVVLCRENGVSKSLEGALSAFGAWNIGIFVTRAAQALPQSDRHLLACMSRICAKVAILLAALPGELEDPDDIERVVQYAMTQAEVLGITGERRGKITLCRLSSQSKASQVLDDSLLTLLHESQFATPAARDALFRSTVSQFVKKIKERAEKQNNLSFIPILEHDQKEILSDFRKRLDHVIALADERFSNDLLASNADVRDFFKNEILGWSSEGNVYARPWLSYVEELRPGTSKSFFNRLDFLLTEITLTPVPTIHSTDTTPEERKHLFRKMLAGNPLSVTGLRIGLSLFVGILFWALTFLSGYSQVFCALATSAGTLIAFSSLPNLLNLIFSVATPSTTGSTQLGFEKSPLPIRKTEKGQLFVAHSLRWMETQLKAPETQVIPRCDSLLRELQTIPV